MHSLQQSGVYYSDFCLWKLLENTGIGCIRICNRYVLLQYLFSCSVISSYFSCYVLMFWLLTILPLLYGMTPISVFNVEWRCLTKGDTWCDVMCLSSDSLQDGKWWENPSLSGEHVPSTRKRSRKYHVWRVQESHFQ